MENYLYVLMAPGYQRAVQIAGNIVPVKDLFPGKEKIDCVVYSKVKRVVAPNETVAETEMRSKLGNKWIGFRRVHEGV